MGSKCVGKNTNIIMVARKIKIIELSKQLKIVESMNKIYSGIISRQANTFVPSN